MFEHRSSDVWTILLCMDEPFIEIPMYGWTILRCMDSSHTSEDGPYIGALMGANMGVFQVADVPTYGYVYTLP